MDNQTINTNLGFPGASNHSQPEIVTHKVPTCESNTSFRSEPLSQDINAAIVAANSFDDILKQLGGIVTRNSNCLGLWFSDFQTEDTAPCAVIDKDEDILGQLELANIELLATSARQQHQLIYHQSNTSSNIQFVACPIFLNDEIVGVLTGCFSTASHAAVRHHWLMTLIAQATSNWGQGRVIVQSQAKMNSLNDAMLLVKSLDATETIGASGRAIVNHMRRLVATEQVSFCYIESSSKQGRLVAVSDVEQVDETTPVNRAILAACQEAIALQTPIVHPNSADETSHPELENYCRITRLNAAVGLPLLNTDGETIGALLVAGEPDKLCQPKLIEYLQLVGNLIGGHLAVVLKANLGIAQRAKSSVIVSLKKNWFRKAAIVIGIAMLAMLIPFPYNVGCECQLEPVVRRFVAAPYDGILEQTFADNGEIVKANQLLARMDGRTLRIELSGVQAEQDSAKKRRDSALATGDIAQSHIARSEMKRHQSQIELLNRRLDNLDVKSPIDGIIVSGDLEKVQGAPLETGQTLFEVGPLNEMVAEIHVPESEIRFIESGQEVRIKLNAYPFETFYGTVKHIHTRSEILSDKNVFVAEVIMKNTDGRLKPGMAGSAKISSGVYPVGWNLFHNAWEKARYWTIW